MARITAARLLRAGFTLADCEDGKFWVIEKQAGGEADRIAAVCGLFVEDMDSLTVAEDAVLQCDLDYSDPVFYKDGFLWHLSRRDFSWIVKRLAKERK